MAYSWQNNKTQNISSGRYSWQTGTLGETLEEKVIKEKQERISEGLPVSIKKTRATPTIGGSIVRGALTPFADIATNIYQAGEIIGKGKETQAPLSNKYLGKVEGLGRADFTKSLFDKENLRVLAKSAATGLEIGSYATGGGAVANAGKEAVKQTAKEFIKTTGKQLAKEGAITSGIGSIGYQGRVGKIDPLQVLRDTVIGSIAGPVLGVGTNKLLGKKATQAVGNVANKVDEIEKSVVQIVDNKTGKLEYKTIPKGELQNFHNVIDDTQKGIAGKEIDGKIYHLTAKTPKQMEERGFINTGVARLDEIPGQQIKQEVPSIKQEILTQEQPKIKIIDEKIKQKLEDTTETIKNNLPESEIPKVDSIRLNEISQQSSDFINKNGIEKARRIAMGIDPEPFKYASQGIHAELANYARKTGDGDLLAELAKSDISKESAQRTGIGRLKEPDNPYYIIKDINNTLKKEQNVMVKMSEKSSIKNIVTKIKEKLPTIEFSEQQLSSIARKLICD